MTVCTFCSGPISVDMDYRRIEAWERKARAASRRGGSDVVLREVKKPEEWACRECIEKIKRGFAPAQVSLV